MQGGHPAWGPGALGGQHGLCGGWPSTASWIPGRVSLVLWDCENLGGVQRILPWGGPGAGRWSTGQVRRASPGERGWTVAVTYRPVTA